jgi:hypothetical protein
MSAAVGYRDNLPADAERAILLDALAPSILEANAPRIKGEGVTVPWGAVGRGSVERILSEGGTSF